MFYFRGIRCFFNYFDYPSDWMSLTKVKKLSIIGVYTLRRRILNYLNWLLNARLYISRMQTIDSILFSIANSSKATQQQYHYQLGKCHLCCNSTQLGCIRTYPILLMSTWPLIFDHFQNTTKILSSAWS